MDFRYRDEYRKETKMIITKEHKGLIDEGYRYKYEGSLEVSGTLEIKLDKGLYVTEGIEADGDIRAGEGIEAGGDEGHMPSE